MNTHKKHNRKPRVHVVHLVCERVSKDKEQSAENKREM